MRRTLLAAVLLAVVGCRPASSPAPAASDGFDGARLLETVSVLAHDSMEGRALGTPGGQRARAWVAGRFDALGLDAPAGGRLQPFGTGDTAGANVLALVPGTGVPARTVLVTAHYDHLGVRNGTVYNGADDNASGVAVLLALAERLSRSPVGATVLLAALDGEEGGLRGARALLAGLPVSREGLTLVLNLDMVGRNTNDELWVVGTRYTPSLRPLVDSADGRSPLELRVGHDGSDAPRQDWTGASDHGPFHEAGIPFLYLGVEDHPDYHQPTDDTPRIDPVFLGAAAAVAWDLLRWQ